MPEPIIRPGTNQPTYKVLVVGRLDDPRKGVGDAADIIALLNKRGLDVTLTVRGVKPHTAEAAQRELSQRAGREVEVRLHTSDQALIAQDRRDVHMVYMTSLAESFGLVATEGWGAGVPVMVPDSSGAGRFLATRLPPELSRYLLVKQSYTERVDPVRWADATERALSDLRIVWDHVGEIRRKLIEEDVTWSAAARDLIGALVRAYGAFA